MNARLILGCILGLLCSSLAHAELAISIFSGLSMSPNSDVSIHQSGSTDIVLRRVAWRSEPLRTPIYSGARVIYWLPQKAEAGFGVDFTHAKALASNAQLVEVSGSRANRIVQGWEPMGLTVRDLGFSHGLNFVTLVMQWRFFLERSSQPYLGWGGGFVLPHVEGYIGDVVGDSYQFGGLALQVMAGIQQRLFGPIAIFSEYKAQYARLDVPYSSTTQVRTNIWVHQIAVGITAVFPGPGI